MDRRDSESPCNTEKITASIANTMLQVQKLRTAVHDYEQEKWRIVAQKVGTGFTSAACKDKWTELVSLFFLFILCPHFSQYLPILDLKRVMINARFPLQCIWPELAPVRHLSSQFLHHLVSHKANAF
jgi:hypothetical protein